MRGPAPPTVIYLGTFTHYGWSGKGLRGFFFRRERIPIRRSDGTVGFVHEIGVLIFAWFVVEGSWRPYLNLSDAVWRLRGENWWIQP